MRKIHFDCVYLQQGHYLIHAKDDLSGWAEARYVRKLTSRKVARFLEEDILSRFGHFPIAVVDGGAEFKGAFEKLLKKAGVRRIVSAPYHPEANGRIERAHSPLINVLAKLCKTPKQAERYLHKALLAV
jgi:transposase InsO family protein